MLSIGRVWRSRVEAELYWLFFVRQVLDEASKTVRVAATLPGLEAGCESSTRI